MTEDDGGEEGDLFGEAEPEEPADEETVELPANLAPADLPFPVSDIGKWELRHARRRGNESSYRHQRKNQFYPIYLNTETKRIECIGDAIPLEEKPSFKKKKGLEPIWPIDAEGNERCWRFIAPTMRTMLQGKRIVVGRQDPTTKAWTLNVWYPKTKHKKVKTVWWHPRHDAGTHGTSMLHQILGRRDAFPFPKSLYAVRDALLTVVAERPNALVLDFFAGSGTTLHATALINAQLGGARRCILVSNNEPGEKVANRLIGEGHNIGSPEYEKAGICESVTWPRVKFALNGARDDGTALQGTYLDLDGQTRRLKWSDGFKENVEYFRLGFVDPDDVARGEAFKSILPVLWLMAGAVGEREESKGSTAWFIPKKSPYAVLIKEREFKAFREKVRERADIEWAYLVTDSEESFASMRRSLGAKYHCVQLYKSYLENFRINLPDALSDGAPK